MNFKDKRGQGLSTNAIILIVLGVIVLVVLIVGFTVGWRNLVPWISGNNVDTIINQCETSCVTQSSYDFCTRKRELKADDQELTDVTCNYLNQKQPQYGVKSCPAIPCIDVVFVTDVASADTLNSKCEGNEGKTIQILIDKKLESYNCPAVSE